MAVLSALLSVTPVSIPSSDVDFGTVIDNVNVETLSGR